MVNVVVTLSFRKTTKKWLDRFNSNLACGCNWSSRCTLYSGDIKLPVVTIILNLSYFIYVEYTEKQLSRFQFKFST